ncbi:hypothetical protein LTR37_019378 [Vermiconidia calcicola]|uniref:Uncharacterized protein n=1 Tax=Vermiconidia calcicola TaxID=1690605 RepID=A0ACC3MHE5_9PEZI|nr:hypothetical protein LTR37_019378 [Vermiconidia calcicola]
MTMANSAAKAEKQMAQHREDIRYLYSSFTKIPALKLSPDQRARLISGFEEFPFDTAVPLFAFKNVSALEICDLDFRQFHGWDRLSEQLRSLTVKRSNLDDPIDLLQHIVLDDMEKRRKRSFKNQLPATPPTPCAPWPSNSPKARQIELGRTYSAPNSPFVPGSSSKGSPQSFVLDRKVSSNGRHSTTSKRRQRSSSPPRTPSSRHDSLTKHGRTDSMKYRRSSGILPPSKWRLLRHLSLAENALTSLTVASLAPVAGTLQSLDLSGNLFTEVPDALASLTHLRALNLSNCMIGSLQTLSRNPLPAITTLNLRSNRLQNLAGIERLLSLERVDVRDNRLRDPMELARLAALPDIVDLYVVKNPFTRTHADYRVTIFNAFRSTPGHLQDVTIDTLGPVYTEKKHMVDRAPEATNVPIVKPPLEDEGEPQAVAGGAPTEAESHAFAPEHQQAPSARHAHRRATSDLGPLAMRRKKKAPRRRIVELSQAESPASTTSTPKQPAQQPTLDLIDMPKTPTDSDHPSTPGDTPYHTAPTTQIQPKSPPQRPTLDTSFTTPTPAPKIRDDSDDDLSPAQSPQDLGHSDIYRQKIEALKSELGPNWLTALNEDRLAEERDKSRGFSPASRTSTIRPDNRSNNDRSVSVSGRTLG